MIRCRAHVPLRSFDSAEQALAFYARVPGSSAAPPSPSRRLDLNSTTDWKFRLFDKPESLPAGVTAAAYDDKDWAKVRKAAAIRVEEEVEELVMKKARGRESVPPGGTAGRLVFFVSLSLLPASPPLSSAARLFSTTRCFARSCRSGEEEMTPKRAQVFAPKTHPIKNNT